MIKIFFIFVFSLNLFAGSLSLYDLGFLVSKQTKKTVVFSNAVDQKLKVIFSSQPVDYLPLFRKILFSNGYVYTVDRSFIYVSIPSAIKKDEGIFGGLNSLTSHTINNPSSNNSSSLMPLPPLSSNSPSIAVLQNGKNVYSGPMFSRSSSNISSFSPGQIDNNFSSSPGQIDENISFQTIQLIFLKPSDINSTLSFSGLDYSIADNSKTLIFKVPFSKLDFFNSLKSTIQSLDIAREQITLKITVFSSDNNQLRDLGFSPLFNLDSNLSLSTGSVFSGSLVSSFYSSLHLMQSKGVSSISDSPTFLISDNDTLDFKSVVNMPFLDENFAFSATQGTNQSKRYKYKPIGFKVLVTPTIVNDIVYLDFTISFESVLSSGDLPITSEKSIKNKFSLKKGDLIVLAGISKQTLINSNDSIPYLSDVPFFGKFFTHDKKNSVDESFNISIEVVK